MTAQRRLAGLLFMVGAAIFMLFSVFTPFVAAQSDRVQVVAEPCEFEDNSILGIPVWYKYLEGERERTIFDGEETEGSCSPVIEDFEAALPIGLAVLEAGMTLAGMVAVVMIFLGFIQLCAQ